MPENEAAPEAPVTEEQALPDTESQVSADQPEAAAPATDETPAEKPRNKRSLDRLSEMGRRVAEAERLVIATAQENQRLRDQVSRFDEFLNVQEQRAFEQRLSELTPEQQTLELARQLRHLQTRPAPVQQVAAPQQDTTSEALRILSDANTLYGLDGTEALTGQEPELHYSRHASRDSFLRTAYQLAQARAEGIQEEPMPAKKATEKDAVADLTREVAKLKQQLGIGRPNAATPSGNSVNEGSIADLNRIASRSDLGPKARIEALKKAVAS